MYNARIKIKETHNVALVETLSFSLERVIAGRAARIIASLAGTIGLLYLVALVPGAIIVALPGSIAAASKIYDEVRLIQYLKYGDPIESGTWESVELETQQARVKASDFSRQIAR